MNALNQPLIIEMHLAMSILRARTLETIKKIVVSSKGIDNGNSHEKAFKYEPKYPNFRSKTTYYNKKLSFQLLSPNYSSIQSTLTHFTFPSIVFF